MVPVKTAVVLAACRSSRFEPFVRAHHKSLFVIGGRPILHYTLASLASVGIKQTIVVKSPHDKTISNLPKSFGKINVILVNQNKPLGTGNAVLAASNYIKKPTLVLNAQHVNIADHFKILKPHIAIDSIIVLSQKTDNPSLYGMLKLKGDKVVDVVEKPTNTSKISDQRLVGIYLINPTFISHLSTHPSSEYQLVQDLATYAQYHLVRAVPVRNPTFTLKYFWDLFTISQHLGNQLTDSISPTAQVHQSAIFNGLVHVEPGAVVCEHAVITGPAYIGENVEVGPFTQIRPYTFLEAQSKLQCRVEIKNSLFGINSRLHTGYLGDCVIGDDVACGSGFISANRRLDRGEIFVTIKRKKVNSKRTSLGCAIGDHARIGIQAGTNPGRIITSNSLILPNTIV